MKRTTRTANVLAEVDNHVELVRVDGLNDYEFQVIEEHKNLAAKVIRTWQQDKRDTNLETKLKGYSGTTSGGYYPQTFASDPEEIYLAYILGTEVHRQWCCF